MTVKTATVVRDGFQYLEGARWHDDQLWFSDIPRGKVYRLGLDGTATVAATVDAKPSGLGFAPDGTVLVVTQADNALRRITADGGTEVVADLAAVAVGANDMWVDAEGRAYITQIGYDLFGGAEPQVAPMIVVHPDGEVNTAGSGLVCPNGVGLSPDGKTLYVAETFAFRISAFDVAADGSLSDQRVFKQFDSLESDALDGLCVDAEGAVWVTCPFSSEVRRIAPDGTVTDRVATATPGHFVVSCALGGPDGRTLYLCTAETDLERMSNNFEGTARVEAVTVDAARLS
ncbi:SMP-30/gluconolactonase/LRE family protein [Nocardia puris]|uniref:Sugar lactone lactonase YvrE n=1 Tax=Nocardia puris TaxID=208602 RepID=A0A366E5J7_9NOCA|nr:SMP-30/gluconolactonase/LRE family protein [Nocardia puris]MBF6216094.1 SMP-30/gluconolactonase/LRE family protein [Nocardia puris]MBF6368897.1 SMP-30/gluconolactonase/LRE family protein [Nocardia puris]MBF6462478.1 SMP-30/gluconolactonase/LRE family protein [Nocardia puris]RBO97059.1 sugar lactone lactonase YvrE [Nocardia puris]